MCQWVVCSSAAAVLSSAISVLRMLTLMGTFRVIGRSEMANQEITPKGVDKHFHTTTDTHVLEGLNAD